MAKIVWKKDSRRLPTRVVLGIMAFTACWCSYMLRVNMSIVIMAMVVPTKSAHHDPECLGKGNASPPVNGSDNGVSDYGPRYNWSQLVQGHVLASYSYGYFLTQLPGGMISELFGGRMVIFFSCMIMAIMTILTPLVAQMHFGVVCALRFLIGLGGGIVYPALHAVIARWAPPEEKSKFIWSLLGGTFGTVFTWPFCSYIVETLGWAASYYITGGIVVAWSLLWLYLIRNEPSQHPRISPEELQYIESRVRPTVTSHLEGARAGTDYVKKRVIPLKKVLTSIPFLVLIVLHYGNLWGLFFIITETPKFMMEVLGYNIQESGFLSGLPSLARVVFGFVFSAIVDSLIKCEKFRRTTIRKFFIIFSHILPGALVLTMGFIGCDPTLSVVVLTLSLGMNGAATVTNLANHHDLAPNFAGSLYGIMNSIGSTTGFIIPVIVGAILQNNNGMWEWRIIWSLGASIYLVSGLLFLFLGSGRLQSWNALEIDVKAPEPAT